MVTAATELGTSELETQSQYQINAEISDTFRPWYALWTRSRHEAVVREQLMSRGIEAFLPTVAKWSRLKDRRKRIDWPLFSGYCFARFRNEQTLAVLTCTGVVGIVSFNGKPAHVAEGEMDALRQLMDSQLACDPCPLVKEGCMVKVINGPLKGVIGQLVQKDAEHATLILRVELINQGVRVTVHAADARPL